MENKNSEIQNKNNKIIELVPTKFPSVFQVRLNLEMQTRFIGKIDIAGDGKFLTTRKKKHLFRKTNSLGINYQLLKDETIPFKQIIIDFEGDKLITSRLYFLTHSKIYTFNKAGFETQAFMSLDLFGIQKAKDFESKLKIQGNLFSESEMIK